MAVSFLIFAVASGALFAFGGGGQMVREALRPAYASASGTIRSLSIEKGKTRRGTTVYYPQVVYAFDVNGTTVTGSVLGPHAADRQWLRRYSEAELQTQYPVGGKLEVSYDADDPSRSYALVPGQRIDYMARVGYFFFGAFNLGMDGAVVFWTWRACSRRRPAA